MSNDASPPSKQKSSDEAAAERERQATVDVDPDAPGLSVLDEQDGDPVEPNEPA